MSVWYAIPSKRPTGEVEPLLRLWRERGYRIALFVDWNPPGTPLETREAKGEIMLRGGGRFAPSEPGRTYAPDWNHYPGYAVACNSLIEQILHKDPDAEWIVTGGDDVEPDPNKTAEQIARECSEYFLQHARFAPGDTFGVMQPTGDRWGQHDIAGGHHFEKWPDQPERCIHCGQGADAPRHMIGAYIDRVCGSPWIGREFARRMYQGNGPYWPEYTHMGVDEELQEVALKLGVLWQRPDLTHYHNHWGRPRGGAKYGDQANMPAFLEHANSGPEWDRYKRILTARRAAGFPGHEPL